MSKAVPWLLYLETTPAPSTPPTAITLGRFAGKLTQVP